MSGITDPAEEYFKDGLWAWVTSAWEKLVADASGFLQINVAAQDIDVEVTQTAAADLTPGVCGWDGSAWHKLPLIFGYSDRYMEDLGGTKSGAGTYTGTGTAVSGGEVWVVQRFTMSNWGGARGRARLQVVVGATAYELAGITAPVQYEAVEMAGPLVLKEGDKVQIKQLLCLDGDVIQGLVWGYKMKIAE